MKNLLGALLLVLILPVISCAQKNSGFVHKGYLGWLMDLSRTARIGIAWPSILLDEALIGDYKETIDFLNRSGMNEITAWGFFTNSAWEPVIEKTIDAQRKAMVTEMISYAHSKGIKILCGLGVYSWGFNKIIKEHPEIKCPCNEEVMDFASPESWEWQKKVIDYLTDQYNFDGFSMQSADRGRCKCGEYANLTDLEYHALLDQKVVSYIRSKNKNYIIGISGWGMNFSNPGDLSSIVKMTRDVDYLIDVEETALKAGADYRRNLIRAISPCFYGSTATPNIEPLQALPRNSYFVPVFNRSCERLKRIYLDGGRASETYVRTRGNIGDEVSIEVITNIVQNPGKETASALKESLERIFHPADKHCLTVLEKIYNKAEDAYFDCATGDKEVIQLMPRSWTSPKSQYLISMSPESRKKYGKSITQCYNELSAVKEKIRNIEKRRELMTCLTNVLNELKFAGELSSDIAK